ncbi:hypothetical protein Pla175_32910 [Pirellulimonas nuda]|uniref:DUF447 family protein n=1 Tax=Pirellulimonas nuda TaxID=2528009 RepID=A0A518DEJ0_9BACT|nr:DUF447 domain-containing protein [Pirellulimonas nuda]QDU89894.1 hypothetical protein Pla175_32910 [Pirellulimonas nuda]
MSQPLGSEIDRELTVLEGLVTTVNPDGSPHVAAMGPLVSAGFDRFVLRPFRTSTTCQNLLRTGRCVAHVSDDVELIARAALHQLEAAPAMHATPSGDGFILASACRWFALRVASGPIAADDERPRMDCVVLDSGRLRDFFGLNRAKHAVIEATILATRLQFISCEEVLAEMERLAPLVEKTGGAAERRAWGMVEAYVRGWSPE